MPQQRQIFRRRRGGGSADKESAVGGNGRAGPRENSCEVSRARVFVGLGSGVSAPTPHLIVRTRGWRGLCRDEGAAETVTALGQRGEAAERSDRPRGKRGEAGLSPGKGVKRFAKQTREENPFGEWVCLFRWIGTSETAGSRRSNGSVRARACRC
jgi:hypothetical protein